MCYMKGSEHCLNDTKKFSEFKIHFGLFITKQMDKRFFNRNVNTRELLVYFIHDSWQCAVCALSKCGTKDICSVSYFILLLLVLYTINQLKLIYYIYNIYIY